MKEWVRLLCHHDKFHAASNMHIITIRPKIMTLKLLKETSVMPTSPYPSLTEFMGMELTEREIALNMPEYIPQMKVRFYRDWFMADELIFPNYFVNIIS